VDLLKKLLFYTVVIKHSIVGFEKSHKKKKKKKKKKLYVATKRKHEKPVKKLPVCRFWKISKSDMVTSNLEYKEDWKCL